jgi:hypothetical protein
VQHHTSPLTAAASCTRGSHAYAFSRAGSDCLSLKTTLTACHRFLSVYGIPFDFGRKTVKNDSLPINTVTVIDLSRYYRWFWPAFISVLASLSSAILIIGFSLIIDRAVFGITGIDVLCLPLKNDNGDGAVKGFNSIKISFPLKSMIHVYELMECPPPERRPQRSAHSPPVAHH